MSKSSPNNKNEQRTTFLVTFTDLIFSATFGAGFAFLYEALHNQAPDSVVMIIFVYLLMCDDWYGEHAMYKFYPYTREAFFLDILEMFNFFTLMYLALVRSTWFIYFAGLYGFHGALWDYYYLRRAPKNTVGYIELASWFWNAQLLAIAFTIIFLILGLQRMFTPTPAIIALILGIWLIWRLFFDWSVKRKIRNYPEQIVTTAEKKRTSDEATIRKVEEKDFDDVALMRHELWDIHGSKTAYIDQDFLKKVDAYEELKRSIEDEKLTVLVIEIDKKIVAYTLLEEREAESFFSFKEYLYWDELFVKEEFRDIGLGRKMLEYVKQLARIKGYPVIIGRIYSFSDVMRNSFKKAGGEELYGMFIMPITFTKK